MNFTTTEGSERNYDVHSRFISLDLTQLEPGFNELFSLTSGSVITHILYRIASNISYDFSNATAGMTEGFEFQARYFDDENPMIQYTDISALFIDLTRPSGDTTRVIGFNNGYTPYRFSPTRHLVQDAFFGINWRDLVGLANATFSTITSGRLDIILTVASTDTATGNYANILTE